MITKAATSIVCGTDFSDGASRASEVAAHLSHRLRAQLVLVHALQLPTSTFVAGEPLVLPAGFLQPSRAERDESADGLLASESRRLAGLADVTVVPRLSIDDRRRA